LRISCAASASTTRSVSLSGGSLNQLRHTASTCGFSSMAVVRMRSFLWQNLVMAAAPRPSCMAWRPATLAGSMNSSQPIMRCTYSNSISNGSRMRMEPWIQGVPRCRWRTSPSSETLTSGSSAAVSEEDGAALAPPRVLRITSEKENQSS
jgi:hypothetical protein